MRVQMQSRSATVRGDRSFPVARRRGRALLKVRVLLATARKKKIDELGRIKGDEEENWRKKKHT